MRTYNAILYGIPLECLEEGLLSQPGRSLRVLVSGLEQAPPEQKHACGQAMAAILARVADRHPFEAIADLLNGNGNFDKIDRSSVHKESIMASVTLSRNFQPPEDHPRRTEPSGWPEVHHRFLWLDRRPIEKHV